MVVVDFVGVFVSYSFFFFLVLFLFTVESLAGVHRPDGQFLKTIHKNIQVIYQLILRFCITVS